MKEILFLTNKELYHIGLRMSIIREENKIPKEFMANFHKNFVQLQKNVKGFNLFKDLRYDIGVHPEGAEDYQCGFAAYHLSRLKPEKILDIGSYRKFILGLLSYCKVTTVDVRGRKPISENETIITCDAKKLDLPDNEFDAVVSLCSLEHFGLGRYGDEIDLDADKKALKEMIRVLKPGGYLIFTTEITKKLTFIGFNAHKVYDYETIRGFCPDLKCIDEKFWSRKMKEFCSLEEVTQEPRNWDIYCGCWEKK